MIKIKIKIQLVVQNLELKYLLVIQSNNIKKATIFVKSTAIKKIISELNMQKKIKYQFILEQRF